MYNEDRDKWFFNEEIFAKNRNIWKAVIKLAPFFYLLWSLVASLSFFFFIAIAIDKKSDESIANFLIN